MGSPITDDLADPVLEAIIAKPSAPQPVPNPNRKWSPAVFLLLMTVTSHTKFRLIGVSGRMTQTQLDDAIARGVAAWESVAVNANSPSTISNARVLRLVSNGNPLYGVVIGSNEMDGTTVDWTQAFDDAVNDGDAGLSSSWGTADRANVIG